MNDAPSLPVLLVEDDPDLAANILDYLERKGWRVDHAPDGAMALHRLVGGRFSAMVLDLRLPAIGGVELCERVRADLCPQLPILMLTAADTLEDRLRGFRAGADDYLTKPFALAELHARLRALVRRSTGAVRDAGDVIQVGDLRMSISIREVRRGDRTVQLTNMGFAILERLMRRSPAVVPRTDLELHLWGDEPPGSDALRTHIATLRAAIEAPGEPPVLVTHRGIGFQIAAGDRATP